MQTSRNGKRIVKIFIIIFVLSWYIPLLIASVIEGWMLYTTLDTKNKIENNEFQQIDAIVTDYDAYYNRDSDGYESTTYGIVCEYEVNGEVHEYYGNFHTNLDALPEINSVITLYYDADTGEIYEEFSSNGTVITLTIMLAITTVMEIAPLLIIPIMKKEIKKRTNNTMNMYPDF